MENIKKLKNKTKLIFIIAIISCCISSKVYAEGNEEISTEEILKNQSDSLGISSFIYEANKYKSDDLDLDIQELITSAIKGKIDNKTIGQKVMSILFSQVKDAITSIRQYFDNSYNFKCVK